MELAPPDSGQGGPLSARPVALQKSQSRRLGLDRLARRTVSFGGFIIIASILTILFVIAAQVVPLFRPPSSEAQKTFAIPAGQPLRTGTDEYRELAYVLTSTGLSIFTASNGAPFEVSSQPDLKGARITAASQGAGDEFAIGLSDGQVIRVSVNFSAAFSKSKRVVSAEVESSAPERVAENQPLDLIAYSKTEAGAALAIKIAGRKLRIVYVAETESLMGDIAREEVRHDLELSCAGEVSALASDSRGDTLFAGTTAGEMVQINTRDKDAPPVVASVYQIATNAAVSTLGFLVGDRTLVVGDAMGRVSTWQLLRRADQRKLIKIYDFDAHASRVTGFATSQRNKGFATLDEGGSVFLRYGTTGRTLMKLKAEPALAAIGFAPKADGLVGASAAGAMTGWTLRNPHPEITWHSLFGKIWYEGYDAPAHVWQSTGGTDDFEAKFSLTPLIYGTLKGTFYALIFAVPIALLGALYASQFMHPSLKNVIKPTVEIMAALPSVVLGFIAGLWLAPMMEKIVPGLLIMPLGIAVCIIAALYLWHRVPDGLRKRLLPGAEIFLLLPVVLLGGWLSIHLGFAFERWMMAGDYRTWLLKALGLTYDQRNSMVVGFAMGFAIVPIIFTIAEDSLSAVPNHLRAGSLALGATPWQTAIRVVLPTASPGIFSAVMIGFGRAVGETMIVLMATGNTPVMNWSIFSGFRALSANIAVELPEAAEGGTLYRVLFLAALLLFLMTFVVNTLAELVRLRLRQRYRVL